MKRTTFLLLLLTCWVSAAWAQTQVNYENITPEQLPAGTKVIPKMAFRNRTDLVEVTIPEGVIVIEEYAFQNCKNLRKVVLPSTLIRATNAFSYCDSLKDVTCLGIVPPTLVPSPTYYRKGEYIFTDALPRYVYYSNIYNRKEISQNVGLYGYDTSSKHTIRDTSYPYDQVVYLNYMMRDHTLSHPAVTPYELESGWNQFPAFKPLDISWPDELRVCKDFTLYQNLPTNKPDLTLAVSMDNENNLYYAGHLTHMADGTLSVGTFNIEQDAYENAIRILEKNTMTTTTLDNCWPTLYTESPMRADKVKTTLRLNSKKYWSGYWIFMSLPFDCRLSDLRVLEKDNYFQWAIRKYSGQMRADAKFDEVWVKQTTDSILHAGEGFIFTCGWNEVITPDITIEFPAINNANKNNIFTTEDVTIPLQQYTASAECDRSWNFIGNPYPCFYSTKYFEPSMPFVVYGRQEPFSYPLPWGATVTTYPEGYTTYSPIDDNYVLHPFQGFFVQRPLGYDALNLPEYGRFATVNEYEDFYADLTSDVDYSNANRRQTESHHARMDGRGAKEEDEVNRRRAAAPRPPVGTMENRRVIDLVLQNADGIQLDRTRLVGNPDATTAYEVACDATKFPDLTGNSTLLYIIGTDDTHYAISEQPFTEGDEVSVGAKFPTAGTYTLQANFKTDYPDLDGKVMLIDYETGIIQPATEPYTFTTLAEETTTRFALTYGNESTGISQTVNYQLSTANYYDLQGRLVTGTPRPGIYIKNGKKFIIK